jgi:glyoxylase-like metal-dependent hydrolase (beta-lactamase superfamily II)
MKEDILQSPRRRIFLCALAASLVTRPAFGQAAAGPVRIGALEVTALSDGALRLPLGFMFPDSPQEEIDALFDANGWPKEPFAAPPINVVIVKSGADVIAIDTGAGTNFMESAGKLAESLAAQSIDPASVTKVILTHAHPDHLWGAIDDFDDSERFPNASYIISAADWDYWTAADIVEKTPDAGKGMAAGTNRILKRLEGKIERRNHGDALAPGLSYYATPGHTPGHMSVLLEDGGARMMILGDALSHPIVSFAQPGWPFGPDLDRDLAISTRKSLLSMLALERMPVCGYHLPNLGWGRVEAHGANFRLAAL